MIMNKTSFAPNTTICIFFYCLINKTEILQIHDLINIAGQIVSRNSEFSHYEEIFLYAQHF